MAQILLTTAEGPLKGGERRMAGILWALVVILLLVWLFGLVVGNLGNILWIALVLAVAIALYNLIVGRTAY